MDPLLGHPHQAAGTRLLSIEDGPGRGMRLLQGWTAGGLSFDVLPDRGFDVHDARLGGRALAFHGPGGLRAPGLYEPRGMESWLRGFSGGLVMTGGLDHTLGPAEDDAVRFAYSGRTSERFPLHGRLTGEPATLLGHGASGGMVWAEGEVRQAMLFGENLRLHRRIEASGATLTLSDTLTNEGAAESPVPVLYHCNLGHPLLAPAGRIRVRAREMRTAGGFDPEGWDRIPEPRPGFREEVVEIVPEPRAGRAECLLANAGGDLALRLSWDADVLPWLFLWRQFAPGTFVLGIEPSNVPAAARADIRERGLMPMLAPGGTRKTGLRFDALSGEDARGAIAAAEEDAS